MRGGLNSHGGGWRALPPSGGTSGSSGVTAGARGRRLAYQPQLDGLRGVAVLAVLLYHAGFPLVERGGYIGVDVFFVLSGYLITTLLLREQAGESRIDLKDFYRRRVRRLGPALVVVALVTGIAYVFVPWAPPPEHTVLGSVTTLGQMSAWPRALGVSHLGFMGHTWSLSVEEHFYLAWPAIVVLAFKGFRHRAHVALLVVALAGIAYGELVPLAAHWSFDRAYNGPDVRAGDILIGCALALILDRVGEDGVGRSVASVGSWVSVVVLFGWTLSFEHREAMYRNWGIVVVVAAALVVLQLVRDPGSRLARALSAQPLVWLGVRSYGIYLIHHPVVGLLRPLGTAGVVVAGGAATLALSDLSYRRLEGPIRRDGLAAVFRRPHLPVRLLRERSVT